MFKRQKIDLYNLVKTILRKLVTQKIVPVIVKRLKNYVDFNNNFAKILGNSTF